MATEKTKNKVTKKASVAKKPTAKSSVVVVKTAKKIVSKKADTDKNLFAVIETGGKQYKVMIGDTVKIEKISDKQKEGDKFDFDKVLLVDDGLDTSIGDPYIKGAKVSAEVVEVGRSKKISVIKYKSKSRYFRNKGHRQPFAKIKIVGIK